MTGTNDVTQWAAARAAGARMRQYEFADHRWSRIRDEERVLQCVVVSFREGWSVLGYEVRLHSRNVLLYRSRRYLSRKLANEEADSLLTETLSWLRSTRGDVDRISRVGDTQDHLNTPLDRHVSESLIQA